jgi:hypothetical protein
MKSSCAQVNISNNSSKYQNRQVNNYSIAQVIHFVFLSCMVSTKMSSVKLFCANSLQKNRKDTNYFSAML